MMETKRILLVEDNLSIALVLEIALTSLNAGMVVHTVQSGEEAQRAIAEGDWDMVIADYSLPGISGLELVRQAGRAERPIAWVMITAFGNQEIRAEAYSLGVSQYLSKPFSLEEFRRIVTSQLEGQDTINVS
jgi:two-component system OmpR family response regulator